MGKMDIFFGKLTLILSIPTSAYISSRNFPSQQPAAVQKGSLPGRMVTSGLLSTMATKLDVLHPMGRSQNFFSQWLTAVQKGSLPGRMVTSGLLSTMATTLNLLHPMLR